MQVLTLSSRRARAPRHRRPCYRSLKARVHEKSKTLVFCAPKHAKAREVPVPRTSCLVHDVLYLVSTQVLNLACMWYMSARRWKNTVHWILKYTVFENAGRPRRPRAATRRGCGMAGRPSDRDCIASMQPSRRTTARACMLHHDAHHASCTRSSECLAVHAAGCLPASCHC